MTEQQKILRVFQLIGLLSQKPHKTVSQLAKILETTTRTVYRYINLLDELGYYVDKDIVTGKYFLFEEVNSHKVMLSVEEINLLTRVMAEIPEESPLKASIRQKIYQNSALMPIANDIIMIHHAKVIEKLQEALTQLKQVNIIRYHSTTSEQLTDRLVEPLFWHDNFTAIEAYELNSKKTKTFKVKRIHDVEVLNTPQQHTSAIPQIDPFGLTDGPSILVKLQLTNRAYRLMIEEYPVTRPYIQHISDAEKPYRFVGEIRSFVGIGRFILGIPGEVSVEEPKALKDYLNGRIEGVQW